MSLYHKLPLSIRRRIKYFRKFLVRNVRYPIYSLLFYEPIWQWRNRNTRVGNLNLSDVQKRIANDLKTQGYALAHLNEFGLTTPPISRDGATRKSQKGFLLSLPVTDFFKQWARDKRVHDIAAAYLGFKPVLYYLTLEITEVASGGRIQSQRWHRDPEDHRMMKMFIYGNDVDNDSGPFTYVRYSKTKYKDFYPQKLPNGSYPPEGAVETHVPAEDVISLAGKSGTIIFADTSGLHRGGYATKKERSMLTAGYATKGSFRKPLTF